MNDLESLPRRSVPPAIPLRANQPVVLLAMGIE